MTTTPFASDEPLLIAHATDLHPDGGVAFVHSVALACHAGARHVTLHANTSGREDARALPEPSTLLERWAAVSGEAPKMVVHQRMTHECCDDPVDTLLDAMEQLHPGLLVVGTHQHTGFNRVFLGSVAEALARNTHAPTLFLPIGKRGFVDEATGEVHLGKILVPISDVEIAARALSVIGALLDRLKVPETVFFLLHLSDKPSEAHLLDDLDLPEREGWTWERIEADAPVDEAISAAADTLGVDLIVTATRGQDSILDVLRGSRSEQVIRHAACPVLSVPMTPPSP